MNGNTIRIQVTIEQINRLSRALESLQKERLLKNPKLFALMAEAPIDHISRMLEELDQYLEELKQVPAASVS